MQTKIHCKLNASLVQMTDSISPLIMWLAVLTFILLFVFLFVIIKFDQNSVNKLKFHLKYFLFYFTTGLVCSLLLPYFLLRTKNVSNAKVAANIIKHITNVIGIEWRLRNGEVLAENRGAIIISNHQSSLDALGLINIWDVVDKLAPVCKKQLFYIWPFGLSAYLCDIVFINRSNGKEAYKQLQATFKLMETKTKIWFFPEGTRNKNCSKSLLPFKKGAFNIAVAAQVPIIPVVYSPYFFINRKKYIFNKGHIIMKCLDPISTKGLTIDDIPKLVEHCQHIITVAYKELSREVMNLLPEDYPITS